ncbi:MAG: hypothetical protein U9Q97_04960 [Acidobacteriota bacterium]|nr:hypothetical protein [Acidobacteriota bacterium]
MKGKMTHKVKIIVEKELGDIWATEEEFNEMTNEDILELIHEDIGEFLEDATFTVVRQKYPQKGGVKIKLQPFNDDVVDYEDIGGDDWGNRD